MKIKKGALLLAALVAAMALALPAGASAARLETSAGALVPVGTAFKLTGQNAAVGANMFGQPEPCETMVLKGRVTENSGVSVKATSDGPGSVSCHGPLTPITEVTAGELTGLSITRDASGVDTSTLSVKFMQLYRTNVRTYECNLEGTLGTTYTHGTNVLAVSSGHLNGFCGPGTLWGRFTVTDAAGNPILLN